MDRLRPPADQIVAARVPLVVAYVCAGKLLWSGVASVRRFSRVKNQGAPRGPRPWQLYFLSRKITNATAR